MAPLHCGLIVGNEGKRRPWPGGYVHHQKDGRDLFILERQVGKERFHVSTRCHSLTAAMKQLERFEADPLGYSPAGAELEAPLAMTEKLLTEFHAWSTAVRGNTLKHANEMGNRLADWMEDLAGADLRKVSLRENIKPALERRTTCRQHRIIALKSFYGWLRKEKSILTSAQDPTLDLPVPIAIPEKHRRRKALERERVAKAYAKLRGPYRDCVLLLTATGWHVTELERFIREADSEVVIPKQGDVLAVLVTRHKGGEDTRTPILDKGQLAAAQRLRRRGVVPRRLNDAVRAACRAAGVEEFTCGVFRHSVGTWAVESGARPAEVTEFLQHKSQKTTRQFYIDVSVPTVSVPTLRLVR